MSKVLFNSISKPPAYDAAVAFVEKVCRFMLAAANVAQSYLNICKPYSDFFAPINLTKYSYQIVQSHCKGGSCKKKIFNDDLQRIEA